MGTSSARRRTFLPSPARRTLVNTLMFWRSYRWLLSEPVVAARAVVGLRAADLVFDPTLACCRGDGPGVGGRMTLRPRIWLASPRLRDPPRVGEDGQDLRLNRTMLSNQKLPYVGRFACDWPRLSTTDPHAAHPDVTPSFDRVDTVGRAGQSRSEPVARPRPTPAGWLTTPSSRHPARPAGRRWPTRSPPVGPRARARPAAGGPGAGPMRCGTRSAAPSGGGREPSGRDGRRRETPSWWVTTAAGSNPTFQPARPTLQHRSMSSANMK